MLDRDRLPSGLLQRIVRMEEQIRLLRLHPAQQAPVDPWLALTDDNRGPGYAFDFLSGGIADPSVYRDRDRVYASGLLFCTTSDSDQPFASLPSGYEPAVATPLWIPSVQSSYEIPVPGGAPGATVTVPNPGWLAYLYPTGECFVQANAAEGASGLPQLGDELVLDQLSWRVT